MADFNATTRRRDAVLIKRLGGVTATITRKNGLDLPGITVLIERGIVRSSSYESAVPEAGIEATFQKSQYPNPVKGDCIDTGTEMFEVNGAPVEDDGVVVTVPVLERTP
jgi:hypothetical protein